MAHGVQGPLLGVVDVNDFDKAPAQGLAWEVLPGSMMFLQNTMIP